MTPRRFLTTAGEPLPVTRLDRRSGVRCDRGNYVGTGDDEPVPLMPQAVFDAVERLCIEGGRLMAAGKHNKAFRKFVAALDLLPEPREQWNAAGWILVAIGENAVRAGSFRAAERPLADAMLCPGTVGNPWVHLRLGQVRFELGNRDAAADELARAYLGGGRAIFDGLDPKYLALAEEDLQPPPGWTGCRNTSTEDDTFGEEQLPC
jgi:tetratricopeptide (TPR) repeat protein